jgi:hypothetical protein
MHHSDPKPTRRLGWWGVFLLLFFPSFSLFPCVSVRPCWEREVGRDRAHDIDGCSMATSIIVRNIMIDSPNTPPHTDMNV